MSPSHIAICELSLARTYQKHGRVAMVRECATAIVAVLQQLIDNDAKQILMREVDELWTWCSYQDMDRAG